MPKYWNSPLYTLSQGGKDVTIDVTTSVSPGLPPHKVLGEQVIPFFKENGVNRILDFGAGALRHTLPLLDAGFLVCSVDFEEGFRRRASAEALSRAKSHSNFSSLIYPRDFIADERRFDAALLCFVLQVMPVPKERVAVLKYIHKKLSTPSYLLYMARYGQKSDDDHRYRVGDGFYKWPTREHHSFYREFTTERTHELMRRRRFHRLRSLSARGTEQVLIYGKGRAKWI